MATKYNYRWLKTEKGCEEEPHTIITSASNSPNFTPGYVDKTGEECKSITDRSKLTHAVGTLSLDWISAMYLKDPDKKQANGEFGTRGNHTKAIVTGFGGHEYLPTFNGQF